MRVFGDDGFRDIFGKGFLSKKFLNFFFSNLNVFLKSAKIKKVIIGYDTRISYKKIISIILTNLNFSGDIEILDKPVPTPCVSYLSRKKINTFFIMITASHFDKKFNGFKFFYKGKKLTKKYEKDILKSKIIKKKEETNKRIKVRYIKDYYLYENYLNNNFKNERSTKNILLDFAYGSASSMIGNIKFFKNIDKIKYSYNYNNINFKCGSNFFEKNLKNKKYNRYDYVIAFDGDADRAVFYKRQYGIIESEKMCIIFAKFLKSKSVISTNISSPDLKNYLNDNQIKCYQTQVGDRNITELQKKKLSKIGFETSGHYSFNNYMDGIFAAGLFIDILKKNEDLINKTLSIKFRYKLHKLNFNEKKIQLLKKIKFSKYKYLKVLVRKSIWSNIFRIYFFYLKNNQVQFSKLLSQVKKLLK
jgi:phosphoglucosamine mutase